MAKIGLGKGIDAVFGDNNFTQMRNETPVEAQIIKSSSAAEIRSLPIDMLVPNPYQPRKEFDPQALEELASSIREHGVVEPIIVSASTDGSHYIVGGERRTRAARLAGFTEIPAIVKKFSREQMLEIALIENIQREDLNALEEAHAYRQLMELGNLAQDEVAKRVGKNRSTIANALRLLKLPEDMQASLSSGQISAGHARAILSVSNTQDQRILFARITGSALSVREAERQAAELNGESRPIKTAKGREKLASRNADIISLEQRFLDALGTKVEIKGTISKGSILIDYYSQDDLERLYSLICSR